MAHFRACSTCKSYSQASLYHCALQLISDQFELTFARFRYSLGNFRPRKTTHLTLFPTYGGEKTPLERVVFHWRHPNIWHQRCTMLLFASHLFYTVYQCFQWKVAVKVHRVLPSFFRYSASARRIQFHWAHIGDSGAIVTPFMQDTN